MNKLNYIKYSRKGVTYYVSEDVVSRIKEFEHIECMSHLRLLQFADFAVESNNIIKSRYEVEDLLEAAVNVRDPDGRFLTFDIKSN
jgi:hypothetical protein